MSKDSKTKRPFRGRAARAFVVVSVLFATASIAPLPQERTYGEAFADKTASTFNAVNGWWNPNDKPICAKKDRYTSTRKCRTWSEVTKPADKGTTLSTAYKHTYDAFKKLTNVTKSVFAGAECIVKDVSKWDHNENSQPYDSSRRRFRTETPFKEKGKTLGKCAKKGMLTYFLYKVVKITVGS